MEQRANPEGAEGPVDRADSHSNHPVSKSSDLLAEISQSHTDAQPLGGYLGECVQRTCNGRLSEIRWFRTDWQRGGALTGYATYRNDNGEEQPAVVKLPVPPREREWLVRLQQASDTVPRLYAHGDSLNGYDFAWIVLERLTHGPLGSAWGGAEFDLLVQTIGRFYQATTTVPIKGHAMKRDWFMILEKAREQVDHNVIPESKRWKKLLKLSHQKLKDWVATWESRPIEYWCHGDLHLANAMTRRPPPEGPAILFDFAEIRPGHWVEDGVYFEHLYWARRDRLGGRKLCKQIAQERKQLGLRNDKDWPIYAQVKRNLLAMSLPARLSKDGDPHTIQAAMEVLERELS